MDSITYWLYFGVTVWSCLLVLAVVIFLIVLVNCLENDQETEDACYGATSVGLWLNAACFALLSLLLLGTMLPLCSSLKTLQAGRMELT